MSDNDLIRRGDLMPTMNKFGFGGTMMADAIATIPSARHKPVAVRVKPLVWAPDSMRGCYPDRLKAVMPCQGGDYTVAGSRKQDKWQWFRNGYFVDGHQLHAPMPLEAAQSAAQSDYEARILSAITSSPEAEVRAEALRESVKGIKNLIIAADLADLHDRKEGLRDALDVIDALIGGEK